jgi:hypothetical protein
MAGRCGVSVYTSSATSQGVRLSRLFDDFGPRAASPTW